MRRLSHRRPVVVSGQRVAGASFFGLGGKPSQEAQEGACGPLGVVS